MSESALAVPELGLPSRRRHWIVGCLLMLLVCGGAYWWQTRLTPDERVLVGRWKVIDPSQPAGETFFELYSDRTFFVEGTWYRWAAHQGRFLCWKAHPFHLQALDWVESGFRVWDSEKVTESSRYEIINHDRILIGEDGKDGELHRVIDE